MHDTSIRGAWVSDVDNELHDAMRSWGEVIERSWTKDKHDGVGRSVLFRLLWFIAQSVLVE